MPPLSKISPPIVYLTPHSQRYRIAVLNFRDQTGRAELVKESIADMLTTELYATKRFNLYDRGDVSKQVLRTSVSDPQSSRATSKDQGENQAPGRGNEPGDIITLDASLSEQFKRLSWAVDGILTGYVTAISFESSNKGSFSTDFRIVNPQTQLVVHSDSAVVHFTTSKGLDSIQLKRRDVRRMAEKIRSSFIDLAVLMDDQIKVIDVTQDQAGAKIVLNIGTRDRDIKQGFAGFVVEHDDRTKIEHYIAKFVIVNVFPEASVGVIVRHCNRLYGCSESQSDGADWLQAREQVGNVRIDATVRLK